MQNSSFIITELGNFTHSSGEAIHIFIKLYWNGGSSYIVKTKTKGSIEIQTFSELENLLKLINARSLRNLTGNEYSWGNIQFTEIDSIMYFDIFPLTVNSKDWNYPGFEIHFFPEQDIFRLEVFKGVGVYPFQVIQPHNNLKDAVLATKLADPKNPNFSMVLIQKDQYQLRVYPNKSEKDDRIFSIHDATAKEDRNCLLVETKFEECFDKLMAVTSTE